MKCPECGGENADSAKFCKKCGHPLETKVVKHENDSSSNRTMIIAAIAIVIVVLLGIGVYASGILNATPMENRNFEYFTMDVPENSNFEIAKSAALDEKHMLVLYKNTGNARDKAEQIAFGRGLSDAIEEYTPDSVEDGIEIYKNSSGDEGYGALVKDGDVEAFLVGKDLGTLKNMAKSFKKGDVSKLNATQTTSLAGVMNANPQDMSIRGGSFSTGSHLSDKTYAKINVGSEHAGENVKIQILYSRDGSSLNDGNMVSKTVTSDGYIEVASADSYRYYPDYAKITIYDESGNAIDTQEVSLSPESGTQNF